MGALCCCCDRKATTRTVTPEKVSHPKPPHHTVTRQPSAEPPLSDIGVSTTDPSKLIDGYENEPVVSLEESLKPFHGKIDNLDEHIKEAKAKCCNPSKHKLTHDESAAIYIYTMKWQKVCVADHLGSAWKSEHRSELHPWFKYLKLFRSGLNKLPDANEEVWQAAPFDENEKKKLISDSKPLYTSMGLGSPSEKDLRGNLEKDGAGRMIFASYAYTNGKVVTGYTADRREKVVLWPGSKLHKPESKEHPDGAFSVHFNRKYKPLHETDSPKADSHKPASHEHDAHKHTSKEHGTKKQTSDEHGAPKRVSYELDTNKEASSEHGSRKAGSTDPLSLRSRSTEPYSRKTGSTTPLSPKPIRVKVPTVTKHFACPSRSCVNRCLGGHGTDHCRAYSLLIRAAKHHHCGSSCSSCDTCGESCSKLYQCRTCGASSCDKCCLK